MQFVCIAKIVKSTPIQSSSCRYMALRLNNCITQFYLRLLKTPAAQAVQFLPQVLPALPQSVSAALSRRGGTADLHFGGQLQRSGIL